MAARSHHDDAVVEDRMIGQIAFPGEIVALINEYGQRAIPLLARNDRLIDAIEQMAHQLPTSHDLRLGDARVLLHDIPDASVQLAVTSPPYWTLKYYSDHAGQLGAIADYEAFLHELDEVWRQVYRVLVPGGRLIVVVGDVCLPRRKVGRHLVLPLHSSIQEHCREIGFDNLTPIIWHKIANMRLEVENGSSFLGKPYEPNSVIKNDVEYILFLRKPGGYRQPSLAARVLSVIPKQSHQSWFQQIWTLNGASTRHHPAPFPLELAERLIRMFSFVGDTVLDPFMGTATTNLAALRWGRNSIGCEVEPEYVAFSQRRFQREKAHQLKLELPEGRMLDLVCR
jgi:DNA modification methylase